MASSEDHGTRHDLLSAGESSHLKRNPPTIVWSFLGKLSRVDALGRYRAESGEGYLLGQGACAGTVRGRDNNLG
jgi:hypothetical protein